MKAGAVDSLFSIGKGPRLNHRFEVTAGVLAVECAAADPDGWRALAPEARHALLGRVADELRRARADLMGAGSQDLQHLRAAHAPQ